MHRRATILAAVGQSFDEMENVTQATLTRAWTRLAITGGLFLALLAICVVSWRGVQRRITRPLVQLQTALAGMQAGFGALLRGDAAELGAQGVEGEVRLVVDDHRRFGQPSGGGLRRGGARDRVARGHRLLPDRAPGEEARRPGPQHPGQQFVVTERRQRQHRRAVEVPQVHRAAGERGAHPRGQRLRALEDENGKLKRLLADAMLDKAALNDLLSKKW